ncbi:hypothetical protein ABZ027_22890 [Streptomyces sp. NPDC006332]|uniref:hypothetical protein n=1 Tax=Streptomyces sp. NPDC006332 TaxID=3155456 RepID=UPI0033A42669
MGTRTLDCPTCGTMQEFRGLTDEEKAAIRAEKGDRHPVDNLWRCTATGCLTYYRHLNKYDRGLLPEKFREEAAAQD